MDVLKGLLLINDIDPFDAYGAFLAEDKPGDMKNYSSLLKPASDRLREYMGTLTFAAPQIPVINNVDVAVLTDPEQIKDALVRQAAGPVRWVETMQKMAQDGITQVISQRMRGQELVSST